MVGLGLGPVVLALLPLQTGVPHFLSTMRSAVFGYKEFLEERRKELGLETLDNENRLKKIYNLAIDK